MFSPSPGTWISSSMFWTIQHSGTFWIVILLLYVGHFQLAQMSPITPWLGGGYLSHRLMSFPCTIFSTLCHRAPIPAVPQTALPAISKDNFLLEQFHLDSPYLTPLQHGLSSPSYFLKHSQHGGPSYPSLPVNSYCSQTSFRSSSSTHSLKVDFLQDLPWTPCLLPVFFWTGVLSSCMVSFPIIACVPRIFSFLKLYSLFLKCILTKNKKLLNMPVVYLRSISALT